MKKNIGLVLLIIIVFLSVISFLFSYQIYCRSKSEQDKYISDIQKLQDSNLTEEEKKELLDSNYAKLVSEKKNLIEEYEIWKSYNQNVLKYLS